MTRKLKFLSSMVALLLCLTASAFGQETTGNVEGTVKDPSGGVVPGVSITITSSGRTEGARRDATTGFSRTVTTDDSGFYRILQVPPGFYTVSTTEISGFGGSNTNNVEVVLGKTTPVDITLQAGGVGNVNVDIVASDASAIDPTDNKIQTNITSQVAELLPRGTNFTSLLKVAPSTRAEPLSGGFQIDGASGSENTFIIDGQEVTNFRTGVLNTNNNLPFQFVQEVQVKSAGFEAEYGGATGGVINVVTKGGSNEFHGEFGVSFRPSTLQGNPRPFLRRFATGTVPAGTFFQTAEYIQPRRDQGTDVFPTGNFSGPIVKDKLWFFASYTPQFLETIRDLDYVSSDPRTRTLLGAERYRVKQRNDYAFLRLDASPTDNLRMTGAFTYNPIDVQGAVPLVTDTISALDALGRPSSIPSANFGGSIGELRGADFLNNQGGRQNSNNITGQIVWTPTSKIVLNFRGGRSFLNEKLGSYGLPRTTRFNCNSAGVASVAALGGCFPGFQNFPTNFQIDFDVSQRKTFDADAAFLVNNLGGRHQFKGGYQYNGISNVTRQGYRDEGQVILYYGLGLVDILGLPNSPGAIGAGFLQRFATEGQASSASNSVFIQDSWQPFSRLSLNLGVRFEQEDVPSFNPDNPGIKFGWGDKIAPRLGFAFDLTGDGKTKLFASFGWFYDRFKYELPRGSFGGDFFRRDYFEIFPDHPEFSYYTFSRILGNNVDVPGGTCPTTGTGLSVCQLDFRIPSNSGAGIFVGGAVDPNLKAARQSEFTIGFERELGAGLLLSTRFTHKKVDRAIEDIGIPTPEGSEAYIIGNPGFGLAAETAAQFGFPATKAERKYDALEIRVDKRFTQSYYFNVNYTYSRLFGNYSGLASADEAGRTSPNVNRFFDLPFLGYNANGEPDNGRLPTDRPHVFKFYGAYTLNWNRLFDMGDRHRTEFSTFFTAQSGTPLTTFYQLYSVTTAILNGRGDLGRTEAFTQTDFAITHRYNFGNDGRYQLAFDLNFLNLFNEDNVLTHNTVVNATNYSGGTLGTGDEVETINRIFNGGIRDLVQAHIDSRADRRFATYGLPNGFQGPRDVRFGFRLIF